MTLVLERKDWDFLPTIVRVTTVGEGLHFMGLYDPRGGTPSLRLDPQKEPAQCIALLNAFQAGPHQFTRAHVLALRLAAVALRNIPMDREDVVSPEHHAHAVVNVASLIESYLRPRQLEPMLITP